MYERLMQEAAAKLDFEQAAKYRNRLWALAHVTRRPGHQPARASTRRTCSPPIRRAGRPASRCSSSAPARTGATAPTSRAPTGRGRAEEVLEAFIAQFYDDKPVPRCIFLSHALPMQALLEEALSTKAERQRRDPRAAAGRPRRDHRRARHAERSRGPGAPAGRDAPRSACCSTAWRRVVRAARSAPRRIEVFDNSHIQGTSAVGAMIVAGPEGFVKNQYRKFNIKIRRPLPPATTTP